MKKISTPEYRKTEQTAYMHTYTPHPCLKTIAIMTSQTQNFLIFWLLILDSKSFQIIF